MKRHPITTLCQVISICVLVAYTAHAQSDGTLLQTVSGKEQGEALGDSFGDHIVETERFVFIGAPREDNPISSPGHIDSGALHIYRREGAMLVPHQVIEGPNVPGNEIEQRFGCGIATMGAYLFVGVANDRDFPDGLDDPWLGFVFPEEPAFSFAGQVHVYRLNPDSNTWEGPVQKLTSDAPASNGGFGCRTDSSHIALFDTDPVTDDPDLAVIGEAGCCALTQALHVFRRNGNEWIREQVITPPGGRATEPFAQWYADGVVAVGNKHVLVTERGTANAGVVHVYGVGSGGVTPVPVQTLSAPADSIPTPNCFGPFGNDGLAASGDTVVIADPCDSSNPQGRSAAGRLNVYHYNPKNPTPLRFIAALYRPNPGVGDLLGARIGGGAQAVDTDGELIAVGTPLARFLADSKVLVFQRIAPRQWNPEPVAEIGLPEPDPYFGHSVRLFSPDSVAITQLGSFDRGGGRVHIFGIF